MTEGAVAVSAIFAGRNPHDGVADIESEHPGKFTGRPKITSINGAVGHVYCRRDDKRGSRNPAVDRTQQDRLFGSPDGRKGPLILADFGGN